MTTPPQPEPAAEKSIGQYLRPLRDLAAWALAGAPAVFLLVALLELAGDFTTQTRYGFAGFVNLPLIVFPVAAVILALGVKPAHPQARLITLIALVEYAVMSFFGVVFGVLFGVIGLIAQDPAGAFSALLVRAAWLAVLAVPAYGVLQIWLNLFTVPKPKQQPGVYGQPYGQPQYGAPQPSYPQYQPGAAPTPGQPYGTPAPNPGQPYGTPVATQPFNAAQPPPAPYGAYPPVPPPVWGPPAETQVVPPTSAPTSASADSTTVLPPERPGFGSADQDPPRQ
ncbi:hypothetical protein [Actinoplanes derwentensis]|uniref:Uncharacterized protein n=1 Tax=Actinoplanes derwentensis TaxID=113562 RepID=A0A1H2CIA1_9ACTN|nr:hypothetical protein [Actinoplanes derwentensis]GID88691.1 hypothetical protein Ade03nite_76150 [Actinoplanes derwentensis]SDT69987.1 hypothetical protein SAMN04489716_5863 [Actinoplanes derwentensis]